MSMIRNGVPRYDTDGHVINAHGVGVLRDGDRFYMFGEFKTDDKNTFIGFSCYSSMDLATWTNEGLALAQQPAGLLGPGRIGERPKVLKNPRTGAFMLYAHADDLGYNDPHIVVAQSDSITGPYEVQGPLLFDGEPLRRWDMGTFEDEDGSQYLLTHEGDIFLISDDGLSVEQQITAGVAPGGESPAMLRAHGRYWLLLSNKTTWERNDNFVLSAPELSGPWTREGLLAPEGTLTHNSQCSFVVKLEDGRHIYLGDRWSFPHQGSAATQVWLPLTVSPSGVTLPEYLEAWSLDAEKHAGAEPVRRDVSFSTDVAGACVEIPFVGVGVCVIGQSGPQNSYAHVELVRRGGAVILSHVVDWYSLVPHVGTRWVSPPLTAGEYLLRIRVTGEQPSWFKKDGTRFGPTGSAVSVDAIIVREQ